VYIINRESSNKDHYLTEADEILTYPYTNIDYYLASYTWLDNNKYLPYIFMYKPRL